MLSKIKPFVAEYLAEFIGSFVFGIVIYLSSLILGGNEPLVTATAFIILYTSFSFFSRANFNPIFTLGEFTLSIFESLKIRKFDKKIISGLFFYLIIQFLAFLLAFIMVNKLKDQVVDLQVMKSPYNTSEDASSTDMIKQQYLSQINFESKFTDGFSGLAFVIEFIAVFVLVLIYLMTIRGNAGKSVTAFSVGLGFFVMSVFASELSGAAFNPFRALVPALYNWQTASAYMNVYLFSSIAGAMLAGIVCFILIALKDSNVSVEKTVKKSMKSAKKVRK